MTHPRHILLTFTAFGMITSIILIATHSSPSCTYAPQNDTMKDCDTAHLTHCKGPAYFFRETYTDSLNVTVDRELRCPWSENVPFMSYFAMGFTFLAIVSFTTVAKGLCEKYVPMAFGAGLLSMLLLGITMMLMQADTSMGMRVYVENMGGNYASHNMFFFTLGLVAFVFVSVTVFTVKVYKACSRDDVKHEVMLETRTGTGGGYQATV